MLHNRRNRHQLSRFRGDPLEGDGPAIVAPAPVVADLVILQQPVGVDVEPLRQAHRADVQLQGLGKLRG